MLGWLSVASRRGSRSSSPKSSVWRCGTFSATFLSIQVSSARKTVPNPPLPSGARILYLPTTWSRKNIRPQYRRRAAPARPARGSPTYNSGVRARVLADDAEATRADAHAVARRVGPRRPGAAAHGRRRRAGLRRPRARVGGADSPRRRHRVDVTLGAAVVPAAEVAGALHARGGGAERRRHRRGDPRCGHDGRGADAARSWRRAPRCGWRRSSAPREHARWARIAVASAKQCGRAVVPPIDAAGRVRRTLIAGPETPARPAGRARRRRRGARWRRCARPAAVTLAIGPEGGWTPDEVADARAHGWTPVRLGARTLRAASMALVALAACQAVWDDG